MKNLRKVKIVMMLGLMSLIGNCTTLANYFLPTLSQRHLRITYGAITEFRWYQDVDYKCGPLNIFTCTHHVERLEHDFDLKNDSDVDRFNDMGFDCAVREKPGSQ